nr:MAG: nucleocapsid protein [Beijing sediment orthomyxo-like virus]
MLPATGGPSTAPAVTAPKEISPEELRDIWVRATKRVYNVSMEQHPGIGTINSIMCLIAGFSRRFNEAVYPSGDIPFGSSSGMIKMYKASVFGLDETHYHLMGGISISPQVRSGMIMALGPLTIALNLGLSQNTGKYREKWRRAFIQTFGGLEDVEKLADYVITNGKTNVSIYRLLGLAAELGATKSNNKAFLSYAFINAGYPLKNFTNIQEYEWDCLDGIESIDFSGKGLWSLWNKVAKKGIEFEMVFSPNENVCKQMFIHGMMGSHTDDLSLMEHQYGITFNKRNEMTNDLKKSTFKAMKFKLPIPKYISKLASAMLNKSQGASSGQESRFGTSAANCYQDLGEQSFLAKRINSGPHHVGSTMSAIDKLEARLKNMLTESVAKGRIEFGNTPLYENQPDASCPYGDEGKEKAQPPFKLLGKYYLSRI